MFLIATDEAGYGPKLGPLVVAATLWQLDALRSERVGVEVDDIADAFNRLAVPVAVGGQSIVVGDSKAVFKPQSATRRSQTSTSGSPRTPPVASYSKLEAVTLAGCRWSGIGGQRVSLAADLATQDFSAIRNQPWLVTFSEEAVSDEQSELLVSSWRSGAARLVGIQTRMVTAAEFNRCLQNGINKSDLLTQSTLGLVRSLIERCGMNGDDQIEVFCDRHGGRRYYAGPLQAAFDDTLIGVIGETQRESRYRVPFGGGEFRIRFSVKGDTFAPVAFSSMVAKYLREKAMESLNAYFQKLVGDEVDLRPTAGYPVDADRFLKEIESAVEGKRIRAEQLIRCK